jgi:hypothetical protein
MKYPDGREVRLGDKVRLGADAEGVVVCSIDNGEYSKEHPEAQWGHLKKGAMIEFKGTYGLIHYEEPEDDLELVARADGASDEQEIAEAWIKHCHLSNGDRSSRLQAKTEFLWAWETLRNLVRSDPEKAWRVVQIMWRADSSEQILAKIAAGPVEEILALHGTKFIDRFEAVARAEPIFNKMLGAVWQSTIPQDVWERVKAVAGPTF